MTGLGEKGVVLQGTTWFSNKKANNGLWFNQKKVMRLSQEAEGDEAAVQQRGELVPPCTSERIQTHRFKTAA